MNLLREDRTARHGGDHARRGRHARGHVEWPAAAPEPPHL